jgi:hypothetical protein
MSRVILILLISISFSSCGLKTFTGSEIGFDSELWKADTIGSKGYRDSIIWYGNSEALDCDTLFVGQNINHLQVHIGKEEDLWKKGKYSSYLSYIYFLDGVCRDSCSDQLILVLRTKKRKVSSAYRGSIQCPGNCPRTLNDNCGRPTPHPACPHPRGAYCE